MSRRGATAARVGLVGMYASANLGDTAIQRAVIGALRARHANVEFTAICSAPADAATTFGLPARHVGGFGGLVGAAGTDGDDERRWRRAPQPLYLAAAAWKIDHHVRDLDFLLISGSGQIDDYWGGPWEQPFRLLAWTLAARRHGIPVAYFGVGVDQLLTRSGVWLVRAALARAQLRVVRDPGSRDALRGLGLHSAIGVCPDPAFALESPVLETERAPGEPAFAVISPIARKAWPGAADGAYDRYVETLARVAEHLLDRGLEVRFVCSQTKMDPPIVSLVQAAMRNGSAQATRTIPTVSVDDYLAAVRGARLVVGARLHAVILALVAGTPVVAVSYARKVRQLMADADLGAHCIDLEALSEGELLQRVDAALTQSPVLQTRVRATAARLRAELVPHFDALASLLPVV